MNRYEALLGVGVLLVAVVAAPTAALQPDGPAAAQAAGAGQNGTAASPPGATLSAAIEVQQAEVDGEMDERTFGVAMARAASNSSKAAVVGDRVQSLSDRLATLRERKRAIETAHESGNMSEARYRAEVTGLEARIQVLARQANSTRAAGASLPPAALQERGVDTATIERLRQNASALSGPETAAIARTVAGPGVGGPPGEREPGPPDEVPGRDDDTPPGPPVTSQTDDGALTTTIGATTNLPPGRNGTPAGPPNSPGGPDGDGGDGSDGRPGDGGDGGAG